MQNSNDNGRVRVLFTYRRAKKNGVFNMNCGLRPEESEGASHLTSLQKEYFRPELVAAYQFHLLNSSFLMRLISPKKLPPPRGSADSVALCKQASL